MGEGENNLIKFPAPPAPRPGSVDRLQDNLELGPYYEAAQGKIHSGDYRFFENFEDLPADAEQIWPESERDKKWFVGNIIDKKAGQFQLFRYSGLYFSDLEAELAGKKAVKINNRESVEKHE